MPKRAKIHFASHYSVRRQVCPGYKLVQKSREMRTAPSVAAKAKGKALDADTENTLTLDASPF